MHMYILDIYTPAFRHSIWLSKRYIIHCIVAVLLAYYVLNHTPLLSAFNFDVDFLYWWCLYAPHPHPQRKNIFMIFSSSLCAGHRTMVLLVSTFLIVPSYQVSRSVLLPSLLHRFLSIWVEIAICLYPLYNLLSGLCYLMLWTIQALDLEHTSYSLHHRWSSLSKKLKPFMFIFQVY